MVVDQGASREPGAGYYDGVVAGRRKGVGLFLDELRGPGAARGVRLATIAARVGDRGRRWMASRLASREASLEAAMVWLATIRTWYGPRARQVNMIAGTAVAAAAAACIAWLIVMLAAPARPGPASVPASLPSTSISVDERPDTPATALKRDPTPLPARPPLPPAKVVVDRVPDPPVDAARASLPLRPEEVLEIQGRLYAFGFNPGPVDGSVGPMTHAAITLYQQYRGLPQTGQIDRDLLERLRRDRAPQVAPRPDVPSYAGRADDPFAPLQRAGDSIMRWFRSIGH